MKIKPSKSPPSLAILFKSSSAKEDTVKSIRSTALEESEVNSEASGAQEDLMTGLLGGKLKRRRFPSNSSSIVTSTCSEEEEVRLIDFAMHKK